MSCESDVLSERFALLLIEGEKKVIVQTDSLQPAVVGLLQHVNDAVQIASIFHVTRKFTDLFFDLDLCLICNINYYFVRK